MIFTAFINKIFPHGAAAKAEMPRLETSLSDELIDPEKIAKYKRLDENSVELLLEMMRSEQKFRHDYENDRLRTYRRLKFAAIVITALAFVATIALTILPMPNRISLPAVFDDVAPAKQTETTVKRLGAAPAEASRPNDDSKF